MRMLRLVAVTFVLAGCGQPGLAGDAAIAGADAAMPPDATAPAGRDAAALAGADAALPGFDASGAEADAASAPLDASTTAPDASTATVDAGVAWWDAQGRPYGQCVKDSDCFFGAPCLMTSPGGQCKDCTLPDDCGDTFEYDCGEDGVCHKLCSVDAMCPRGLRCDTTLAVHACTTIACSGAQPCPAPYVCESGACARPTCAAQQPSCPEGMLCGAGNRCVENYE